MDLTTPRPLENRYGLPVTPKEAAVGIAATLQNAKDLLEDAEILLRWKRYPRANCIIILAIEEFELIINCECN